MSYPAISPCAMAPIVHAANRRRARLASSADHPGNVSDVRALAELDVAALGRYRGTMLELQPVNTKSEAPARTLSSMDSSMESTSQQILYGCDNVRNYNYPHMVQLSPPASSSECITFDHNGNNENFPPYNYQDRCSQMHHTDNYRCNTCKLHREVSHLCTNTSLPRIVTDDNDPGDMIPTIFSSNESGVYEMTEADQDINVFAGYERRHEDGLLERGSEFGAQCYIPEKNVSALHSEMVSCIAEEQAEVQPNTGVVYNISSSETYTISPTTASSTKITPQTLSDAHTKPGMDKQPSLVEIGRCSLYLDTQTGQYHSMVYGSFPRDGHCSLDTMKDEAGRYRSTLDSNEDQLFLNTQPTGSCSLPNISTLQLSSYTSTAMDTTSHDCVSLKRSCVGGSVNDRQQCCECEHSIEDDDFDQVRAGGRRLSVPGHKHLGRDSGGDQLVHTYPGAVACKPEATRSTRTQVSTCECRYVINLAKDSGGEQLVHSYPGSNTIRRTQAHACTCECRDVKSLSTLTRLVDKNGAVCQRCCAHVPAYSVSEDHLTIIQQANSSPTYFPLASPSTQKDDPDNTTDTAGNLQGSNVSDTEASCSQSIEQKGQNRLHFSTKHNTAISSLSSMIRNIFPGKTRDKSQMNKGSLDRQEHNPNYVRQSESQFGVSSAPENECYSGYRHLTEHIMSANNRQRSPRECSQEVCQNSNNRAVDTGSDQPTHTENVPARGDIYSTDDNTEAKKLQLRRYRELNRNYVAYLCCPPDALFTFGLPFHRLLESWGLPIFIPERNLPASGPKYQNMAACVEDSCNGKVIVILSDTYATSDECLFLTFFARTLDPDSRHRNIIPVMIDSGVEIPSVLRGLSLIKYNHLVRSGWLKEKLVKAIAA